MGAWIDLGVDPGIYARELMAKCKDAAARVAPCKSAPVNILTNGFYDTTKMVPSQRPCMLACLLLSPLGWPPVSLEFTADNPLQTRAQDAEFLFNVSQLPLHSKAHHTASTSCRQFVEG